MDLKVEAQRVMAVALGKMYSSRLQRGGIRLHKSLLLSLVLRSARDVYLNVRAEQEASEAAAEEEEEAAAMEIEPRAEDRESGADLGLTPSGVEAEEVPVESECSESASNGIPRRSMERECIDSGECIDSAECIGPAAPGRYNVSESPQGRPGEAERSEPSVCPDCDTSGRPLETAAPELGRDVAEETPATRREAGDLRPTPGDGVCGSDRSRKRRKGSDQRDWAEPECLPNKRARLEEEEALVSGRPEQEVETSNIHSLVSVFGSGFTGLLSKGKADSPKDQSVSPGQICRDRVLSKLGIWVRAIVAY